MENSNQQTILTLFSEKKLVKICAPMVRYSKLQFRNLVQQYGCDLTYTPMIMADSFCQSLKARNNEFTTNMGDRPIVVQFAANTVHDFVGAAHLVSPYCDGVDLNCGCPQRWAKQIGVGCCLLDNPELIADLVKQCRNRISKPLTVSVKMRILKESRKTIDICKQLEMTGVSYLAIHARTASQHNEEIDKDLLKLVVENVKCPVVANGGIKNLKECHNLQEYTNCKGIMVANSILINPTLFSGSETTTLECVQKWVNLCYNSTLNEKLYLDAKNQMSRQIPDKPLNLTFQCFHHHLVFMLEKILPKKVRRTFNNLNTFKDVLMFLNDYFAITPQLFDEKVFENCKVLNTDYLNRDLLYKNLNKSTSNVIISNVYDSKTSEGKFFESKISRHNLEEFNLDDIFK